MYNQSVLSTDRKRFRMARDEEFASLYAEALQLMISRGVAHPRRAAIRFTIHNGHPRYHVSFDRAYVVVCRLMRNRKAPTGQDASPGNNVAPCSLRNTMWREIASRVAMLTSERTVSIAAALEFVLEHCRASRFFITEEYADSHLDAIRRSRRRRLCGKAVKP